MVDLDVILFLVLKMNELILSHDACVVVEFHVPTKAKVALEGLLDGRKEPSGLALSLLSYVFQNPGLLPK